MEKHFEQSYTGVRSMKMMEIVGLYILHPNNIGRCGHICNANYTVKDTVRGQGVGKAIVTRLWKKQMKVSVAAVQCSCKK